MLVLPIWLRSSPTAIYSPPLVNGAAHLTVTGSTMNPPVSSDSVLPRPFRLESLGVPVSNGKVRRKKSKSHIHNEGIWKDCSHALQYLNTYHCHLFINQKIVYTVIDHRQYILNYLNGLSDNPC